jgi:hypothetical protein
MINILTLKVGTRYGPEYCNRLFLGIQRHCSIPMRFFTYTDDSAGLLPDITTIDLVRRPDVERQWYKIDLHSPDVIPVDRGELCVILDIDQIVVGSLDDVFRWPLVGSEVGLIRRWWSGSVRDHCEMNGGFQMFRFGDTAYLPGIFYSNPEHWQRHYIALGHAEGPVNGEQNFVNEHLTNTRSWLPESWFGKFDPSRIDEIQRWFERRIARARFFDGRRFFPSFKMIHFANPKNQMSYVEDEWLKELWHD